MDADVEYFMGVDPGFKGALCVIKTDGTVYMLDTPLKANVARPEIDAKAIVEFIKPFGYLKLATIESVSAMPGNGTSSMFRFGFGAGLIHGVLQERAERILSPPAAVWKLRMGLTHNKSDSIELARKSTNAKKYGHLFTKKKHDGRAEALLLAIFGMRSLGFDFNTGNLGEISELF